MTGNLKALVVGTGFGCRIQIPALRGAGFDVVGLVGQNSVRTADRASVNGVDESFTDLALAIATTGADLVAISSPPHAHAEHSITALEAGCHVLCEKPFAANVDEAQAMLASAERAGKVHFIGHEFRFEPLRATVAAAVTAGMIGEPRLANITILLPQLTTQQDDMPDWWYDKDAGGGWLGALGSHVIDQLRTWLGEFASVSATLTSVNQTRGLADDSFTLRFRMASGVDGIIQSSAASWGPMLDIARICGSEGTLWTEQGKVYFAGPNGARALEIAPGLALPPAPPITADPRHATPRWQGLVQVELSAYTVLCRSLKAAIEGASAPSPVRPATFHDGVACMNVLDAIRASALEGGKVVAVR